MISLVKKDYDSTKIYRKTHKKGASQTYDTPSFIDFCSFLFRYAMNDIGDDAPYHEAVGLVDTDGRVGLVPGNEPAEGSAFVDLELLDGKLAIYEGYDEVAVGWFYLAVDDGKVAVKDAGSCHAVA